MIMPSVLDFISASLDFAAAFISLLTAAALGAKKQPGIIPGYKPKQQPADANKTTRADL